MYYKNLPAKLIDAFHNPGYTLRYWQAKLLNKRLYDVFPQGFPCLQEITIFLTYQCNLNCSFCSIKKKGKEGLSSKTKYLSFDSFKNFISQIKTYHPKILITGGEPFIVPSWEKYLNYLNENRLNYSVFTNGTKIFDMANEIFDIVSRLKISLDGPDSTVHDKIRGEGSFKKIIQGLEKISKLKQANRKKRPKIEICFTIIDENYNYLLDMINLLKNLGNWGMEIEKLNFQHLFYVPEEVIKIHKERFKNLGFSLNKDLSFPSSYSYGNIDVEYLIDEIKKVKNYKLRFSVAFFPDFKDNELLKFYKSKRISGYENCIAPYTEIVLTPEGKMEICPDYEIGEVTNADFDLMACSRGEKIKRLKEYLKKDIFPACLGCCHLYKF